MARPTIPKSVQKEIALKRIGQLFQEADRRFSKEKDLADRYMALARKIAMKAKVHIPSDLKRRMCKHCYQYLRPGVNCRVRKRPGKVVISCLECKKFMRIPVMKNTKL